MLSSAGHSNADRALQVRTAASNYPGPYGSDGYDEQHLGLKRKGAPAAPAPSGLAALAKAAKIQPVAHDEEIEAVNETANEAGVVLPLAHCAMPESVVCQPCSSQQWHSSGRGVQSGAPYHFMQLLFTLDCSSLSDNRDDWQRNVGTSVWTLQSHSAIVDTTLLVRAMDTAMILTSVDHVRFQAFAWER